MLPVTSRVRRKSTQKTYSIQSLGEVYRWTDPTKSGPTYTSNPVWDFTVLSHNEVLTDEVLALPSDYRTRSELLRSTEYKIWKKKFKNCSHTREGCFYSFAGSLSYSDTHNPGYLPPYSGFVETVKYQGVPFIGQWVEYSRYEHPVTAWDLVQQDPRYIAATTFDSNRIRNMMENLTTDPKLLGTKTFSIANFLMEFRQSLDLVNILKLKLSSLSKQGSDKFLAYNFGIKPLIGDIEAIYDIVHNMNRRIDKWNAGILAGVKTYNTHITMSKEVFTYSDHVSLTHYSYLENHISGSFEVVVKGHCYFTPQLISKVDVSNLLWEFTGLDSPLGIIWEAIPYSFLIDWLFKVGDVLEAFEAQPSILRINAEVFGYSVKVKGGSYNAFKLANIPHQYSNTTCPPGYLPGGTQFHNYDSFNRVRIEPANYPTLSPLSNGDFVIEQSATHIALGAALIIQRR